MNRYKFSKIFNERFGQNIPSYLNNIRTEKSAELLRNPDLNIIEIAYSVGYRNVDHFNRVFRGKYGMSPKEYRKRMGEKVDKHAE